MSNNAENKGKEKGRYHVAVRIWMGQEKRERKKGRRGRPAEFTVPPTGKDDQGEALLGGHFSLKGISLLVECEGLICIVCGGVVMPFLSGCCNLVSFI